jgi:hypothetical protein
MTARPESMPELCKRCSPHFGKKATALLPGMLVRLLLDVSMRISSSLRSTTRRIALAAGPARLDSPDSQ